VCLGNDRIRSRFRKGGPDSGVWGQLLGLKLRFFGFCDVGFEVGTGWPCWWSYVGFLVHATVFEGVVDVDCVELHAETGTRPDTSRYSGVLSRPGVVGDFRETVLLKLSGAVNMDLGLVIGLRSKQCLGCCKCTTKEVSRCYESRW
jgi:hypothetical protein